MGSLVGRHEGVKLGVIVGSAVVGSADGMDVLGSAVGITVGMIGSLDGEHVGMIGSYDGSDDGIALVGIEVGAEGATDGMADVGAEEGDIDGSIEG